MSSSWSRAMTAHSRARWSAAACGTSRPARPRRILLTSPGRGPAEGDALLEWMREHEEEWRG